MTAVEEREREERNTRGFAASIALLLMILAAGLAIGLLVIPEGGASWMLWGFEKHRFTVGEEEISLRLDTSGAGPYEVECRDNRIQILRNGGVLLEGGFLARDVCAAYQRDAREAEDCRILEDGAEESALLVCSYPGDGGTQYAMMIQIEGAGCGAVFHTPAGGGFSQEEAVDNIHRVQFQKLD